MTLDAVTGLYYARNRNYSPSLGVWISQDPLQYVNGANTYQMEMSGPVGSVDPGGLFCWACWRLPLDMLEVQASATIASLSGSSIVLLMLGGEAVEPAAIIAFLTSVGSTYLAVQHLYSDARKCEHCDPCKTNDKNVGSYVKKAESTWGHVKEIGKKVEDLGKKFKEIISWNPEW